MDQRKEAVQINSTEALPKILIVDDEPSIQAALKMALEDEDYELHFAENGKLGLQVFQQESPELIFLDLKMPVMDGYDFLKSIKFKADSPYTLVVITGHGDDLEIERCYKMGIDFFLKKPLNMVEVCGLARRCIELKRLEKEKSRLLSELKEGREKLEQRVAERTAELSATIDSLEHEINQHTITATKLEKKTRALQESNIALEVLLKRRDEEQAQYSLELKGKIEKLIQPYLDRLKGSQLSDEQRNLLALIEQNLAALASPFLHGQLQLLTKLTAKEIQVANLIKQGLSSKEIASLLEISTRTVETHRFQIRKKFGIEDKNTSLRKVLLQTY